MKAIWASFSRRAKTYIIASAAVVLLLIIIIASCSGGGSSPSGSGPVNKTGPTVTSTSLRPATATAAQICQAIIGTNTFERGGLQTVQSVVGGAGNCGPVYHISGNDPMSAKGNADVVADAIFAQDGSSDQVLIRLTPNGDVSFVPDGP